MKSDNSRRMLVFARYLQRWIRITAAVAAVSISITLSHAQVAGVDIPGPDGLYYPDWRQAGIPGGIPNVSTVTATITVAQAQADLAGAIESAATASGAGGGVILLPPGTYSLMRPVLIKKSNIVLRGAGMSGAGSTILQFQYQAPTSQQVEFYKPDAGTTTVYSNTWIEMHADPTNLVEMHILAKKATDPDTSLKDCSYLTLASSNGGWGNSFSRGITGATILGAVGTGSKTVVARAVYGTVNPDGSITTTGTSEARQTYTLNSTEDSSAFPKPTYLAAINFCGAGYASANTTLAQSAVRGATSLQLNAGGSLQVGDPVVLHAPNTTVWNSQVGNTCTSDIFRFYQFAITGVSGNTITLNQPLRIDYPIEDTAKPPFVRKLAVIQNCGVENLTLQQMNNVWTSGISFSWAWKCWAQNVTVNKPGRHPIYMTPAKWGQIENCVFNDAWWHEGGGTAYCGFETAYDCLMQNVQTTKLRHGPLVQCSAAGNVIRNSQFTDSEAHWHAGWTNENLFENDTIIANIGNGSYGYGLFSSAPNDVQHGPNGPRNAVYNCDVSSPLTSVWLGGSNKDWLFLYTRFAADSGEQFYAKAGSSGHVFENNVCVLQSSACALNLSDAASSGSEFNLNQFTGIFNPAAFLAGQAMASTTLNTTADKLIQQTFTNNGFESGTTNWSLTGDNSMSQVVTGTMAHSGTACLRVTDASTSLGSSIYTPAFPVSPGHVYAGRFYYHVISGAGIATYLLFYNSSGTQLSTYALDDLSGPNSWQPDLIQCTAPLTAATAKIRIHSYSGNTSVTDFDDFEFGEVGYLAFGSTAFDPGFEGGQWVGWNATGDGGMSSIITDPALATNHLLQVNATGTGSGSSLASPNFPATSGHTYQVRCEAATVSGSGLGLYLRFFNSGGSLIGQQAFDVPADPVAKQYTLRAVAPASAATANVWIHSNPSAVVNAQLDDFVVLDLPPRPQPVVPSIFDWQRNPLFPLANAGFESGSMTSWDNTGDGGMTVVSSAAAHTGTYGVRVTDTSTTLSSSLKSPSYPVIPGVGYKVSFWTRLVSGSGIGVYMIFLDAGGSQVGSSVVNVQSGDVNWTQRTGTFTAPATAATAYVRIHSFSANVVTADFDDVQFSTVLP